MIYLLIILSILWFIRTTKIALFYIYLWQLKEYQVKRFLDHFATAKGRHIILNGLNLVKIILAVVFFFQAQIFFYLLLALYLIETIKAFLDVLQKRLKKPVLTKKTAVLIPAAIFLEILFLWALFLNLDPNYQIFGVGARSIYWLAFGLLIFDILSPIVFSLAVLAFQPLTVLLRNQIIKKAKKKIEQHKELLVIGITGSYGKTSTKEFLAAILSEKAALRGDVKNVSNVLKTKAHQNSEMGISQCILNDLKKEHKIFIVEMGAYGKGGINLLCDIVKPKIGILIGINEQHLALYGSQENIIKTKYELIKNLPTDGTAIFNGANKYCPELYKKTEIRKKLCNGNLEGTIISNILGPDIWAEDIKIEKEWISFRVCLKEGEAANFRVNLIGRQHIENILLAVCCAKELGMSLEEISKACLKIKPEQGGTKFLKKDNLNIVDASYSANPNGVIADLDYLKIYSGKKIIIMPCLIELGWISEEVHGKIGRKISEVCDLAIITTKDKFKEIKKGAVERGMKEENVLFLENPQKITDKIKEFCLFAEAQKAKEGGSDNVVLLGGRIPAGVVDLL